MFSNYLLYSSVESIKNLILSTLLYNKLENPWSQGESLSVVKAKANRIQYCESCFQLHVLNIEFSKM